MGTIVGYWAAFFTVMAFQTAVGTVIGKRHLALGAGGAFSTFAAKEKAVIPAAIEKDHGLLTAAQTFFQPVNKHSAE